MFHDLGLPLEVVDDGDDHPRGGGTKPEENDGQQREEVREGRSHVAADRGPKTDGADKAHNRHHPEGVLEVIQLDAVRGERLFPHESFRSSASQRERGKEAVSC